MAFILQPPFKFQSSAHQTGHLILVPKGYPKTPVCLSDLWVKHASKSLLIL